MKQASLKLRLENFLKKKGTFIASGELQRLAQENGYWSPQNTGRRLRELENEGKIEVEYRKGHAWYRAKHVIAGVDFSKSIEQLSLLGSNLK